MHYFIALVCLMLLKICPIRCKVTAFLGEISLEIYVFHGMFLELFGGEKTSWGQTGIYFLLVVICSIPVAWLIHILIKFVEKRVFTYFEKKEKKEKSNELI